MSNQSSIGLSPARRILLLELISKCRVPFTEKLEAQSITPLAVLRSTHGLLAAIEQNKAEILILSVDALDDDALQSLILVKQNTPLPAIIFARKHEPKALRAVVDAGVSSYIVDDVEPSRIPVIIDLAEARFIQEHQIHQELRQTKEKLFDRKIIEKAKGIIMLQKKVSEDQAYAELRRSAMNQGRPMADLAQSVISVYHQRG